ncbi:MAG: hypothetical protein SPJ01_07505 [Butyricicoccus sp.]|nr:hypothetical protein [Butyricicoccus sp.]
MRSRSRGTGHISLIVILSENNENATNIRRKNRTTVRLRERSKNYGKCVKSGEKQKENEEKHENPKNGRTEKSKKFFLQITISALKFT